MTVQSIGIELDRPSGVYYAGEVVRGTVRLNVSDDKTKCRGFHLNLVGKSHVHWHAGSGDSRSDYDGTTYFQDQRFTVYGNFYKTGLLDNAGEDALFDMVHNSGVILIPCNDAKSLNLIVRAMDYDWGKRDDLLGEITLNASVLAGSGRIESFPLTRRGRPEKGEVTLSAKILPFDAIFPRRSRSGAEISLLASKRECLVLRVHQATGLRKADMIGKNDVYVQVYEATEPVQSGKALPGPDKKVVLPQSETIFPFAFQLRNDAPGSAELRVGDRSYVRYYIRANVDLANWRDPNFKRHITVLPNRPLPLLTLLGKATTETIDAPIHNCKFGGFKCCLDGLVSLRLSLDRRAYAPGETIDFTGSQVVNDTKSTMTATVSLRRHAVLRTATGYSAKCTTDFYLTEFEIPPLSTTKVPNIESRVPAVFPSFHGGLVPPFTFSSYPCLKWTYVIDMRVGYQKGKCKGSAHAITPVLISAAPPYERVLADISSSSPVNLAIPDPWAIFDHAITGPEASETCPTITGPEDGGMTSNADQLGAMTLDYELEDAGALSEPPLFQPIVNTFSNPIVQNTPAPSAGETGESKLPSTTTSKKSLDKLLEDMDMSFDKRRTVGEWCRDHSQEVIELKPTDLSTILGKVTFSLDQPAVVGEFAAAFEGTGKLTCSHVVAAMNACPYQKAEVAKLMAVHVRDPENKESVLSLIDFEYERRMVVFGGDRYA
jgi:hypothetical protein